ncbi:MAG TPA: hypothetical protein VFY59_04295 [Rubrobacter sp.]|nr:hypothetical protein [Rubrobacter sp.]
MTLHTPDKRLEPRGVGYHPGRYPLLADEDLISLLAEGDGFAFGGLYERHSRARNWRSSRSSTSATLRKRRRPSS